MLVLRHRGPGGGALADDLKHVHPANITRTLAACQQAGLCLRNASGRSVMAIAVAFDPEAAGIFEVAVARQTDSFLAPCQESQEGADVVERRAAMRADRPGTDRGIRHATHPWAGQPSMTVLRRKTAKRPDSAGNRAGKDKTLLSLAVVTALIL
jgi:hypothetical protein